MPRLKLRLKSKLSRAEINDVQKGVTVRQENQRWLNFCLVMATNQITTLHDVLQKCVWTGRGTARQCLQGKCRNSQHRVKGKVIAHSNDHKKAVQDQTWMPV